MQASLETFKLHHSAVIGTCTERATDNIGARTQYQWGIGTLTPKPLRIASQTPIVMSNRYTDPRSSKGMGSRTWDVWC